MALHERREIRVRDELLQLILDASLALPEAQRLVIGIAGAPASGKSTLAEWLVERLNTVESDRDPAVLVPMDGYHLDNAILDEQDLRAVKGAPHTFDAAGFLALLQRLSKGLQWLADDPVQAEHGPVFIPVFDRSMDLARCAASAVLSSHRIVIVEGNYLLLQRPVWRDLAACFDMSVLLDVPFATLEQRLVQRWLDHGLSEEAAKKRALSNDIPNASVVVAESAVPDVVLRVGEGG